MQNMVFYSCNIDNTTTGADNTNTIKIVVNGDYPSHTIPIMVLQRGNP
jgi:hypothetical protein